MWKNLLYTTYVIIAESAKKDIQRYLWYFISLSLGIGFLSPQIRI